MDTMVVVIAYGDPENTLGTVYHLMKQTQVPKIVVWNNGGDPKDLEILTGRPNVLIHHSAENRLWTPAINMCIEGFYEDEPIVGFMNNDIFLPEDAIEKLSETARRPSVGLVAPVGARLGGPQDYAGNGMGEIDDLPSEKRVSYVIGACCLLRKSVWDEVGELDWDMPLGADDHDYSMRIKHAGYEIIIRQDVFADHKGHASSKTVEGQKQWQDWGGKSWEVFNNKWAGYYATEEEALKGHWEGNYYPEFSKGTGWTEEQYVERVKLGKY